VLDKADEITLYSLNPDKKEKKPDTGLQGWQVLGQTTLSGEDKKAIVKALNKAIAASDGSVAGCFNPRHGIKATHGGKTVELVICFECLSISGWTDGERFSTLTSRQAEEAFNKVLKDKGVKLPKQRE
jgi:GH18 family chitinase